MKTLILKEAKWRCGDVTTNPIKEIDGKKVEIDVCRGKGNTELKNKEGYMCCLGQFTQQLKPGTQILQKSDPSDTEFNTFFI